MMREYQWTQRTSQLEGFSAVLEMLEREGWEIFATHVIETTPVVKPPSGAAMLSYKKPAVEQRCTMSVLARKPR